MKTAILIPVYNEEKNIERVVKDAKEKNSNVIVVIDGSTDNSLEIVKKIEGIHLLVNEKNLGLTETMKNGFKYALEKGFDIVIKIDGDGQMNIEKFDSILKEYNDKKVDVVSARYNKNTPWMVKKDIWIYSFLFSIATKINLKDILSEYRLFSLKAMNNFIESDIKENGSNLSIINLVKKKCSVSEVNSGVNYNLEFFRPAHINILIDCRIQFIKSLWFYGTIKAKIISILSFFALFVLLIFNITVGYKYNSIFTKNIIR